MNSQFNLTNTTLLEHSDEENEITNTLALIQDFYNVPIIKLIDFYGHSNYELIFSGDKEKLVRSLVLLEDSCIRTADVIYEDTCNVSSLGKEVTDSIRFYLQQPIFSNNNEVIGLIIIADSAAKHFDKNLRSQFNVFVNLLQSQMQLKTSNSKEKESNKVLNNKKFSFFSLAPVALLIAVLISLLAGSMLLSGKSKELKSEHQYQSQKLKMTLFNAIERFDNQAFDLLQKDKLLVGYLLSERAVTPQLMQNIVNVNNKGGLKYKAYALVDTSNAKVINWSRNNFDLLAYDLISWTSQADSKAEQFNTFSISDTSFLIHRLNAVNPNLYTISAFNLNDFFKLVTSKLNTQDYSISLSANGITLNQAGEVTAENLKGAIGASVKIFPSSWRIYVRPQQKIITPELSQNYILLVTGACLIIFCFIYYFLRLPRRLHNEIESQNKSILRREMLFSNAINALPDGFAIFDSKDQPVINNKAYLNVFSGIIGIKTLSYQKLIEIGKQKRIITHYRVHHKLDGEHDRVIDLGLNNGRWFTVLQRDMVDGGFVSYFSDVSESHNKQCVLADILDKSKQNAQTQRNFIIEMTKQLSKPATYIKSRTGDTGSIDQKKILEVVEIQLDCVLGQLNQFVNGNRKLRELSHKRFNFQSTIKTVIDTVKSQANGKLIYSVNKYSEPCYIKSDERFYCQLLMHLLNQLIPTVDDSIKIKAVVEECDKDNYFVLEISFSGGLESSFMNEIKSTEQRSSYLLDSDFSLEYQFFKSIYNILNGRNIETFINDPECLIKLKFLLEDNNVEVDEDVKHKSTPTILLVDDDPLIELIVKSMLKDQDFVIDYAKSAIEALILLTQNNYTLILMDIVMPELSGVDALDKIKQYSLCNKTAIIAHTGHEIDNCYEYYVSHGFDDVLIKPIEKGRLLGLVRNYI